MSVLEPLPVNGSPPTEAPTTPVQPATLPDEPVTAQFVRDHLGDVQGNILKGHGRPYVKCIFVTFDDKAGEAAGPAIRAWIRQLAGSVITSAPKQLAETERYQTCGIAGGLFGAFFLSSAGYRYLGINTPVKKEKAQREVLFLCALCAPPLRLCANPFLRVPPCPQTHTR